MEEEKRRGKGRKRELGSITTSTMRPQGRSQKILCKGASRSRVPMGHQNGHMESGSEGPGACDCGTRYIRMHLGAGQSQPGTWLKGPVSMKRAKPSVTSDSAE